MVYRTVKETDARQRPVALCVDTTPSIPGSWQQFVPYTDIIMPDICEFIANGSFSVRRTSGLLSLDKIWSKMLNAAARAACLSTQCADPISGRPAPPHPPPAPPGECGKCPAVRPILYGNDGAGFYCKAPNAAGGHECCLLPGSAEACQGVERCGTNPSNFTPCDSDDLPKHGAASIGPALDRVRAVTDKPIIFIAQAFGGGESYPRAPTAEEERLMTVSEITATVN